MIVERSQFGLALALSTGVNLLLFLLIAWSMAVTQGLTGSRPTPTPPANPPPPEVISLSISVQPEAPTRQFISSPDESQDTPPTDPATRFISSANLKAASEEAPVRGGVPGLATQQGLDKPYLDLRDNDFHQGEAAAQVDRPVQNTPALPALPPSPSSDSSPLSPDTPPEKAPKPADPELPNASTAPPAFRDSRSQTLLPVPAALPPPIPKFRQNTRPPSLPTPLTRIPDHLPDRYQPGTRKSQQLGTISNKGASSVDATATAEGRFSKLIRTAIEKGWRRRMLGLAALANPGLVEVEFEVDPKGRISNVKLANPGEANPVMQDCALSAVIEAKLPPPPSALFQELQDNLTGGKMRCSFSFLIY